MISTQNTALNGVAFQTGMDVTADLLTALQSKVSNEIQGRTKDLISVPGVSWGLNAVSSSGKSVLISKGVGIDSQGIRLEHKNHASYLLDFPDATAKSGYLCVRAVPIEASYRVHPYNGTRAATEIIIGLDFYIGLSAISAPSGGGVYPSDGVGLVLAKLALGSTGYEIKASVSASERSPYLKML